MKCEAFHAKRIFCEAKYAYTHIFMRSNIIAPHKICFAFASQMLLVANIGRYLRMKEYFYNTIAYILKNIRRADSFFGSRRLATQFYRVGGIKQHNFMLESMKTTQNQRFIA